MPIKVLGVNFVLMWRCQATTPLDPRVLDTMLPYMIDKYGNPHSRTHAYGWESEDAVEVARKQASVLEPSLNHLYLLMRVKVLHIYG